MKAAKSSVRKRPLPSGYMCFTLDGSSHAQRAAFSTERREEVHEVRKVGACLRCQLLKKSCSKGAPCTTCVRAAASASASRSLAWMDCIRPSLLNVTIYGSNAHFDPDLRLGGVPVLQYLAHGDVDLKFDIPFEWNIDELSAFVAGWLVNDHDAPRQSMVGIMSSASLLSVISNLIGSELAQVFKALIYTSSLIFNSSTGRLMYSEKSTDVRILRNCGHRLLMFLESQIKPSALARLARHELYALFLLLLGCIISSKYVAESLGDLSRLSAATQQLATHQQVQPSTTMHSDIERSSELIRLLSHHMVYIGHCTGLLQDGTDKNLIEDLTSTRWRKKATFTWETEMDDLQAVKVTSADPECQGFESSLLDCPRSSQEDAKQRLVIFGSCYSAQTTPVWKRSPRPDSYSLASRGKEYRCVPRSAPFGNSLTSRKPARTTATEQGHPVDSVRSFGRCASCHQIQLSLGEFTGQSNDNIQARFLCTRCSLRSKQRPSLTVDISMIDEYALRSHRGEFHVGATLESTGIIEDLTIAHQQRGSNHEDEHWHTSIKDQSPANTKLHSSRGFTSSSVSKWLRRSCGKIYKRHKTSRGQAQISDHTWSFVDSTPLPDDQSIEPSSPLDFTVASFDPTLPTNDIDMNLLLQSDNTELWPCLKRMPTPPLELDFDLQQQLGDPQQQQDATEWLTQESRDVRQTFTAASSRCSCSECGLSEKADGPFDVAPKRLLF